MQLVEKVEGKIPTSLEEFLIWCRDHPADSALDYREDLRAYFIWCRILKTIENRRIENERI